MFRRLISHIPGVAIAASLIILAGCIHNDIPYPRIAQKILAIAAEGESKAANIDSLAFEVTVYLDETTDIQNVRFSEYRISEGGKSTPNLLEGTYDLRQPMYVTLSRFQDYDWEIKAVQDIERYFVVEGEVGESVVDAAAHRVVVNMPEGTDLSDLTLVRYKLGPEGITTVSPDLVPGKLDLLYPKRVEVTCHGRTEIWTIYAQITELVVSTTQVDAWAKVIWAYGAGPADVKNGFQYRKTSDSQWTDVPEENITRTQGNFSCFIPHLEPLTEYAVRTVSGENFGNEMKVTTSATADIPDGDFENWHLGGTNGKMWCPWAENGPRFWDTGNTGSITLNVNLSTPNHEITVPGSSTSAELKTQFVGFGPLGKLGAGSIFTGEFKKVDGTNGILGFGRPWTLRPTKLKGYYRYDAKDIDYVSAEWSELKGRPDSCTIYVALTDWTAPYEIRTNPKNRILFDKNASYVIAYGEMTYSGHMTSFEPFEIKIDYRDTGRVPSYLQITCATSKYGDYFTGGNGSVLYVDQFSFDWDY